MRNIEKWKSGRLIKDPASGAFKVNRAAVYGGSHYIADIQTKAYIPLIQSHISGEMLDCGCGPVPYFELYAPLVSKSTCIDRSADPHVQALLDAVVDLAGPLPFPNDRFDSVLLTDVLAHVPNPGALMGEIARVLKPGGCLVLTTPFIYWLSEYPHEYYHPSRFALENLCRERDLEVEVLGSYGGRLDVLMDTLNKMMASGNRYRIYRLLWWLAERTGWLQRDRNRTSEQYAIGYCMVARKPIRAGSTAANITKT